MSLADTAKLLLIPTAYKTSKLYSVKPINGDGDFTFSRGSNATRINQGKKIELVNSNIPRLDYSDGGCPSLLLEPQRTNTYLTSEPTANEGATGNITYESHFWENGLQNAVRFEPGITGYRYGGTAPASTEIVVSFYVKMNDGGEPFPGTISTDANADFRITVGNLVPTKYGKEYVGNDIWRVWGVGTSSTTFLNNNGPVKYSTQSDRGFICTGFQLEAGSYPTSYIPTTGSAVTRLADNCYGAGDSNLFNDSEGVIYIETKLLSDVDALNRYITLSDNAGSPYTNHLILYFNPTGFLRIYKGGFSNIMFNISPIDLSQNHKIALQYKENDNKLYIDGIEQSLYGTFVETSLNGLNNFSLTLNNSATFTATSKTKDIRIYNEALTDAELATLTTL